MKEDSPVTAVATAASRKAAPAGRQQGRLLLSTTGSLTYRVVDAPGSPFCIEVSVCVIVRLPRAVDCSVLSFTM